MPAEQLIIVQIFGSVIVLNNLTYPANTNFPVLVEFNFRASQVSAQTNFKYEILESVLDNTQTKIWSGLHCFIAKPNNLSFRADPPRQIVVNYGSPLTLSATPQTGTLNYNWYDNNGNLVGTGTTVTVTAPPSSAMYKLEVISPYFCFSDIAYTNIIVNQNFINTITPNPATTQITVDYRLDRGVRTARIDVIDGLGVLQISQGLNVNQTTTNISIVGLQPGTYTVQLIVDGQFSDSKNFIKR